MEMGNFFLKIALAKVTHKIGLGNYFLLILCWDDLLWTQRHALETFSSLLFSQKSSDIGVWQSGKYALKLATWVFIVITFS